ncbi:MAG: hypothetical protein U5K99_10210 [Anaerolineales bacterium]|nr:hypothetical protein [Anaerolineales bacterium]
MPEGVAATLTKQAFQDSIQAAQQTGEAQALPSDTPEPPPSLTPAPTFTQTVEPSLTPTSPPQHVLLPGSPTGRNTFVLDLITVDLAKDQTAVGDNYAWSRMERPYTAETMEYLDFLDIWRADMQVKDPWVYVTFVLVGDLPQDGDYRYAVELDIDHEGRGEYLVMASLPPDDAWTTDDVWVLEDADGDVGGFFPLYEDTLDPEQNGYEREIFHAGKGEDPDLAWVRRDPDHTNQLQLAFKRELIGLSGLLWNPWTDGGIKDPGLFDFNDHFTFEEAGSPNKGNYRYPVKAVAQVDSTCRVWYGFIPTGEEPGLCTTGETARDDDPDQGYCVAKLSAAGCQSACLLECPQGETCLPCQLP